VNSITPSADEHIIGGAPMLLVPAGDFLMGSTDKVIAAALAACSRCRREEFEGEMPQHLVYLDAFWMAKFELRAWVGFCLGMRHLAASGSRGSGSGSWRMLQFAPIRL
jgi:hypothetical protein